MPPVAGASARGAGFRRARRSPRPDPLTDVEVVAHRDLGQTEVKVTEGIFTFVAIDEQARPRPVESPAEDAA